MTGRGLYYGPHDKVGGGSRVFYVFASYFEGTFSPHSPCWLERKYETVHVPYMFTNCKFQWKGFQGLVPDVVNLHKYCLTLLPPSSNQYIYIYMCVYIYIGCRCC